jgi:hypothetical protein
MVNYGISFDNGNSFVFPEDLTDGQITEFFYWYKSAIRIESVFNAGICAYFNGSDISWIASFLANLKDNVILS